MPFREAVWQALQTLRAQRVKTFFSLLGTLVGVTFLIVVISVVHGMNRYMADQFGDVHTLEIRRGGDRHPPITVNDANQLQTRLHTLPALAKSCETNVAVRSNGRTARVQLIAADESYFAIRRYQMTAGRAFSAPEMRAGQPVLVIGEEVATKLLPGLDPIGRTVTIEAVPYRIVGVVAKQGAFFGMSRDRFAIGPFTAPSGRLACTSRGTVNALLIQPGNLRDMRLVMGHTEGLLRSLRRLRPGQPNNFDLQMPEAKIQGWEKISRTLLFGLSALVSIALVVGGIVIMNVMLIAVAERTTEIGIRRALGARQRDILMQFLVEAAVLSLIGALLGIGLGIAATTLMSALTPLPAAVAPWSLLTALLLGIVTGMVAGVYPATRAARLDPITALRAE